LDVDEALWLEDVDVWTESEVGAGTLSYVRRIGRGVGHVSVLSAVFPAADLLADGLQTYRRFGPDLAGLLSEAGVTPLFTQDNPNLDLSLLSGEERRVVCIANATAAEQSANVQVMGARSFTDVDTGERSEDVLQLTMPPWTIKVWETV
jgi:hypothetical protein